MNRQQRAQAASPFHSNHPCSRNFAENAPTQGDVQRMSKSLALTIVAVLCGTLLFPIACAITDSPHAEAARDQQHVPEWNLSDDASEPELDVAPVSPPKPAA